jgi:hypothetical protein
VVFADESAADGQRVFVEHPGPLIRMILTKLLAPGIVGAFVRH